MTNDKQTAKIVELREKHGASSETINTLAAGSVLVIFWRRGETQARARYKITRNGKATRENYVERKFYSDAGHGWFAVKTSELRDLGILEDITHYSYQKGGTTYLEEDSDASKYVKSMALRGITVGFNYKYTDRSPIRSYAPFITVHNITVKGKGI